MPPSPVMRVSPGREMKAENRTRGRSFDSGFFYREKEDDLALFNEVQNKERESFLLQSDDNFDDIFSTKIRYLPDNKLGICIPTRGESSDLLNVEGDKNDYDWLITPPETPLFRSLDDEVPPVNLAPRGRPRSQPTSISRSPTMEKSYGSGKGGASPHRLSPSPRSGNSTLQSRSRPFSATSSSPPPTMKHPSPSRRLSPPPSKPTPAPRSITPTPRRMSTGSAGTSISSKVRGTSPMKTSRGNSSSPKIRAWQSNIPGFSSEAPPNLRTSLADRPVSYVRGSSPASRSGSRYGRHSMSPTASRSVTSSHSHDQDRFSSQSRGSVASSGEDDLDSLQSIPVSGLDQSAPRNIGAYPNNTPAGFSKKSTKVLSSSAPKKSFDLVRQMDRKGPHNMFRPLLSSVPSSTFHKHPHSPTSRNSSITSSNNASSDQAASGTHDTEGIKQNQDNVTTESVKGQYPDMDDEVFAMEQADDLNEDIENRILDDSLGGRHGENDGPRIVISPLDVPRSSNQLDAATALNTAVYYSDADSTADTVICPKCGHTFHLAEIVVEGNLQLCLECKSLQVNSTITNPPEKNAGDIVQILDHRLLDVLDQSASVQESLVVTCTGRSETIHLDRIANETQNSYSDSSQNLSVELFEEGELTLASQNVIKQLIDGDTGYQQLQHDGISSNSMLDVSEGAGMSLLLKRSSSMKGHIVQSRSYTASSTSYDDFSYARDSVNSMRSSIEHTSGSVSSSVDMGSSKQTEIRIYRQSSGHKSDTENYRYEIPAKHNCLVPSVAPSCHEDSFDIIAAHINKEFGEETCEQSLASECTEAESSCTDVESKIIFKTASDLSIHLMNDHSGDTSASHENGDNSTENSRFLINVETSSAHSQISDQEEDDATPSSCADRVNFHVAEIPNPSSLDAISEIKIENDDVVFPDSQSDVDSTNSKRCTNELQYNDAITATVEEFDASHHPHGVLEESRILFEDTGQTKGRSLTLEEATDAILFCSSIVHNIAYEAAHIATDNETLPVEVPRPAVTFMGKSNSERRDMHVRKRSSKSLKARQKRLEKETKPPSCNAETNENSSPHIVGVPDNWAHDNFDSMKPPKLESKCNCTIM